MAPPPPSPRRVLAGDAMAAVLLLVGGWVHLELYFDGYRDAGEALLGRSFLANAAASAVVAALLLLHPGARTRVVRVAGVAVAGGTLVAFALSRRGGGVFGLRERGLQPAPEALVALVAEIGALGVLLTLLALDRSEGGPVVRAALVRRAPVAAAALVVTVALGVVWSAAADDPAPVAAPPSTAAGADPGAPGPVAVAIVDFAFVPPDVTVAAGSEVTWTNQDGFAHSVVAEDDSFRSEDLGQGAPFSFTFATPGTFAYVCGIHPSMEGTVTVT